MTVNSMLTLILSQIHAVIHPLTHEYSCDDDNVKLARGLLIYIIYIKDKKTKNLQP